MLPVLLLVDTLGIGLGKGRLVLKSRNGDRELSHWVKSIGGAVDKLLDKLGNIGAGSPLSGKVADLLFARYLAS